jgi:Zn-dependent M16 (insulinase) family peptidase
VNTLEVYARAADFIRSGEFTDEDVKEAILQVCSEIDKPDPPGPAARKAFYRKLVGLSDEIRLENKKNLLALKKKTIMDAADRYFTKEPSDKAVAVISNSEQLKAANEKLVGLQLSLNRV